MQPCTPCTPMCCGNPAPPDPIARGCGCQGTGSSWGAPALGGRPPRPTLLPAQGSVSCPVCRWQQPWHFGAYPSQPWPCCRTWGGGPALPCPGRDPSLAGTTGAALAPRLPLAMLLLALGRGGQAEPTMGEKTRTGARQLLGGAWAACLGVGSRGGIPKLSEHPQACHPLGCCHSVGTHPGMRAELQQLGGIAASPVLRDVGGSGRQEPDPVGTWAPQTGPRRLPPALQRVLLHGGQLILGFFFSLHLIALIISSDNSI